MSNATLTRPATSKPDIRAITRLVHPSGNLVQGQSELPIDPALADAAAKAITANKNHYCPSEGIADLRAAIAARVTSFNRVEVSAQAVPLDLLVTHGGTGALVAIAQAHLARKSVLLFEPYYPYHRKIVDQYGGAAEVFPLVGHDLRLDVAGLRKRCAESKDRSSFPLRAIVVCSPANPTGKVFSRAELDGIAAICQELDLLCIADEVYECFVESDAGHVSIASLPGMRERTITVNSFSKSWNVSGWRLGYVYGPGKLIAPLNPIINVAYVNSATPLQHALAAVLPSAETRYPRLRSMFSKKREWVAGELRALGFSIYESGSAFYIWAQIPEQYDDANALNTMLIAKAGVGAVPGSAFADGDEWNRYMRFCIAREESVLESALAKLKSVI